MQPRSASGLRDGCPDVRRCRDGRPLPEREPEPAALAAAAREAAAGRGSVVLVGGEAGSAGPRAPGRWPTAPAATSSSTRCAPRSSRAPTGRDHPPQALLGQAARAERVGRLPPPRLTPEAVRDRELIERLVPGGVPTLAAAERHGPERHGRARAGDVPA